VAAPDPVRRNELAWRAELTRWFREHALGLMWLFQLVLPPVVVLALPAKAQVVFAIYIATVPVSIGITWRVTDSRKR
jgi:hypothetical protein